ncbi:hypothetical protein [Roseibium sp.]|uniref:hypothetical protein n=1 Tax=Roseibium sp. TaxID=1936156 RepID=UPI003A96D00F
MRTTFKATAALLALVAFQAESIAVSMAATFNDPTWPCLQRKVENLSLGLMWQGALDEAPSAEKLPADAGDLAVKLSLRRISLEEAEPLVLGFVETHPGADEALFGQIFSAVFKKVNTDRRKIISGIASYSAKQIALAEKIDTTRKEMDDLLAQTAPDYDRIDKLEEQLDWDERIYQDRAKSLTYVCETPVLLEKRLYAIAKLLSSAPRSGN